MRKIYSVAVLAAFFYLTGCSSNIVFVSLKSEGSSRIRADISNPATQDASGEGAFATEGAAAALGMARDVLGNLVPDMSETTTTTTQPPLAPVPQVQPPLAPTPAAPAEEKLPPIGKVIEE